MQLSLVYIMLFTLLGWILPNGNNKLHYTANYLNNAGNSRIKQNTRIPGGGACRELGCVRLLIDYIENDARKPYCRADNLNNTDDFFWSPHNVFYPPWISIFPLCNVYFVWIGSSETGTLCS